MIQMKTGVYGGDGKKLIRPEDGPFSLTPEEEARLVKRGVAKYVSESGETVVEGKSLDNMSAAELRMMAKELGLPAFRVGMTKAAMAEAIAAKMEQAEVEDDEQPVDPEEAQTEEDVDTSDEEVPTFDAAEAVQQ